MVVKTILIVDDEPSLLSLLRRFLERAGYQIESASSGEAALQLFEAEPDKYSVLVTDMTMDGMGGEELTRRIRLVRPDFPAVLMSGYPFVPQSPNTSFLQKPFLPAMLTDAVRDALK